MFKDSVKRIPVGVKQRAARIKLLLLDVDGVLTDGGIILDDRGGETKRFDVRDGQGIALLLRAGIQVGFMTGRSSKIVQRRAKELGVRMVYQGVTDKAAAYDRIKTKTRLKDEEIAFIGDDLMDVPVLRRVGLALAVRDAWPGIRRFAHYISRSEGGRGAVREICDILLIVQGKLLKGERGIERS